MAPILLVYRVFHACGFDRGLVPVACSSVSGVPLLERFECAGVPQSGSVLRIRTGMSDPPRRSSRFGGVYNTDEKEDPLTEDSEALAQRAIDAARLAQLASEQGTPAKLYPDPFPLTGDPLTSTTTDVGGKRSSAEPTAPRMTATHVAWQLRFRIVFCSPLS